MKISKYFYDWFENENLSQKRCLGVSFFFIVENNFFFQLKNQERHAIREKDHVKPDGSTLDYEKNLVKIATRGGNDEYQSKVLL